MNDFPEYDDLPDDPEVAFVRLYERYHKEYLVQSQFDKDSRTVSVDFMNKMLGIARGWISRASMNGRSLKTGTRFIRYLRISTERSSAM